MLGLLLITTVNLLLSIFLCITTSRLILDIRVGVGAAGYYAELLPVSVMRRN